MKREVTLKEISSGRLYEVNDMAKADCQDCKGCSACCSGMGESIVLDPLDMCRLREGTKLGFEDLMQCHIELNVVDSIILPNLKMHSLSHQCNFLDEVGRCSIHLYRPGICRIFPLGRIYENNDFKYFLQVNECKKTSRSKIKVSKWIDCDNVNENQKFINYWHFFLKDVERMIENTKEEEMMKQVSMYILNRFYRNNLLNTKTFYTDIQKEIEEAREALGV